jgi:Plasma-membrane choline transporter
MGYCESGKNVMTLFHNRGWEAIIADDLVGNTLLLVSFMVGGLTGIVAIIVEVASGFIANEGDDDYKYMAFFWDSSWAWSCAVF